MTLAYLSFTARGKALADRLAAQLGGRAARCGEPLGLAEWTQQAFAEAQGLVYVGAAGIAVRAVAPHLQGKTRDPAVVVVDECGRYAIPVLSGHLGGANALARRIAQACGAEAVITTATDARGVFAVDEWAVRQNCAIVGTEKIKTISSALLAGGTVRVRSEWELAGPAPAGVVPSQGECDVLLSIRTAWQDVLQLVPRIAVLGMGCRRGTPQHSLECALEQVLRESGIDERAICMAATIDLKRDEPGLAAFCAAHGWPLAFYGAAQLAQAQGSFTASAFVQSVAGVDNVCERSAQLASGGALCQKKIAGGGVTAALALKPYAPDWRWQNE